LLPIDEFRRCGGNGYRRAECKACTRLIELYRRPELPDFRVCRVCGVEKSIYQFPRTVGYYRQHRCRSCENARKLADYYKRATAPNYQQEKWQRMKRAKLARRMKESLR
jgi:hypothetical protein